MIISISGTAGSGKSTSAKLLSKKLDFKHYSMGDLRRKMAEERGITLAELNKLGEKDSFTDKEVDDYQRQLGKKEDNFVVDCRLGFHFIPHSIKFYLDADPKERAKRVFQQKRDLEKFRDVEHALKAIKEREESDKLRYKKHYNLNCYDKMHYDYVIDTTRMTPEQVITTMLEILKNY